jgi:cytoskeleton protein RodZ
MSESNQVNDAVEQSPLSVGEALTTARKAKNLEIDDVCAYLRLSPRQVLALENNDFSVLPEATITRGFIRNYARMLELNPEPLVRAYGAFSPSGQPQPISIPSENIMMPGNEKRPRLWYVIASVVIVLLVVCWAIYMDYSAKPFSGLGIAPAETSMQAGTVGQTVALPQLSSTETQTDLQVTPAPTEVLEPLSDTPAEPAITPQSVTGQVDTSATGLGEIRIKARESSWVRITDAANNKVMDKILASDIEEVLQGQPPFQVIVGNAPGTTLIFNQQPVDLAPVTGSDKVARLKLE